jgi:N6-L-threonylcarbamoyladenine synthase
MQHYPIILAIDTSCDDTSVAITQGKRVLSNIIASQANFHRKYGGVHPSLAKRMHNKYLSPTMKKALQVSDVPLKNLDAVAVTIGPGLAPALETGILFAKKIVRNIKKPLLAVNHMEGHLLSSFAQNSKGKGPFSTVKPQFPILGLLISGGHTQMVLIKQIGKYRLLGETLDDAAGEAFDKLAKMLNLGYPGGPIVSELAKKGKPLYKLPVPMSTRKDLNFSFSGLKTACLYQISKLKKPLSKTNIENFSASFVFTVSKSLTNKLKLAINQTNPKCIILGGGVISNSEIRNNVRKLARKHNLKVYIPYSPKLFTDNAAMIGVAAYFKLKKGEQVKDLNSLDRLPSLNFSF